MNKKLQILDILAEKLLHTIKRFPIALLSAYLFTIILIILSTLSYTEKEALSYYNILNKIALLSGIGFFLFTSLRLISRNYLLIVLGFVILISYYVYLPDNIYNLHKQELEFSLIIFSLLLIMVSAPYLTQSTSNIKFWNWTKHLILSLLLSAVFSFIIFLGLSGGVYISEKLFMLEESHRYIGEIALLTVGCFGSYFFLSQLPKYPRLLHLKPYTNIEKIFTQFILTPLFVIYFLLLYSYTAIIIFLGEWPKEGVSISILIFSTLSILTYLSWTPLWNKKNQKYKNIFWWTILFQTFLLALALYLRVQDYGWTINRYMIAVVGFWLWGISIYFISNKKASYRTIFISLPILLMLALFSPFSASIAVEESQQTRLKELLSEEKQLSQTSDLSLKYNISSSIDYLYQEYGIESLLPIIPEIVTSFQNKQESNKDDCTSITQNSFTHYATEKLGFKYVDRWQWEQSNSSVEKGFKTLEIPKVFTSFNGFEEEINLKIEGYNWLISFQYFRQNDNITKFCSPIEQKNQVASKYTIQTKRKSIIIEEEKRVLAEINITTFLNKIIDREKEENKNESQKSNIERYYSPRIFSKQELTYSFDNEYIDTQIIFDRIEFLEKDGIIDYRGNILIKEK